MNKKRLLLAVLAIVAVLAVVFVLGPDALWGDEPSVSNEPGAPNETNIPDGPDTPDVPDEPGTPDVPDEPDVSDEPELLAEDGSYTSKEDVALYIHQYGKLPGNFITKKEAQALGWEHGSLEPYAPGKCIGGDRFGNYEGLLPKAEGRTWTECDIDTLGGGQRGAKRIVFSNDGLIYYTEDHYESFECLYGEE